MSEANAVNSLQLTGSHEDLDQVRNFVAHCLQSSMFSERDQRLMVLAVDEAVCQIASSAEDTQDIRLQIEVDETRTVARIIDSKTDFTPEPNYELDEEWRKAQARQQLGIFLIRQIMDEVQYIYRRGFENELVLLKFLPAQA